MEDKSIGLTIVMPAFNAARFIHETLQSISEQQFKNWRLIVIDDASTDNTWEIIQEWSNKDARILGIQNPNNMKVAKTMNFGISLVDTPYFARVDSDDVLLPHHFLRLVEHLDKNENIDICGTQVITINNKGEFQRKWNYETDPIWIKISSLFACPFLQSSVLMRTKVINALGGYREEMELIEDYELWIRALQKFNAANLPEYTIKYRIHEGNMSENNKTKMMQLLQQMYKQNSRNIPIDVDNLELHAKIEIGEWSKVSHHLFEKIEAWKNKLITLNSKIEYTEQKIYRKVIKKYFANIYLKIATQNSGLTRGKALLFAFIKYPNSTFTIIKRKIENKRKSNAS